MEKLSAERAVGIAIALQLETSNHQSWWKMADRECVPGLENLSPEQVNDFSFLPEELVGLASSLASPASHSIFFLQRQSLSP